MITVKDDSALIFGIEADDKFGNPVVLDAANAPAFTLSDDSFGAIVASAGTDSPTSYQFISNGKLGVVQLQAAIGEIKGILDLNVVAGAAVSLKISASQA